MSKNVFNLFLDYLQSNEKDITSSNQQLYTKAAKINKRNAKGETCLHLAAKKGNLDLVKSLIASGACVNQKDNAGRYFLLTILKYGVMLFPRSTSVSFQQFLLIPIELCSKYFISYGNICQVNVLRQIYVDILHVQTLFQVCQRP